MGALKTTESITKDNKQNLGSLDPVKSKFPRKIVIITCFLIGLGFVALFVENPFKGKAPIDRAFIPREVSKRLSANKKRLPAVITSLAVITDEQSASLIKKIPPLFLSGTFFSDGRYVALINNQVVEIGDSIEGVQIKKIGSNGVAIKFRGSLFQLSYP